MKISQYVNLCEPKWRLFLSTKTGKVTNKMLSNSKLRSSTCLRLSCIVCGYPQLGFQFLLFRCIYMHGCVYACMYACMYACTMYSGSIIDGNIIWNIHIISTLNLPMDWRVYAMNPFQQNERVSERARGYVPSRQSSGAWQAASCCSNVYFSSSQNYSLLSAGCQGQANLVRQTTPLCAHQSWSYNFYVQNVSGWIYNFMYKSALHVYI